LHQNRIVLLPDTFADLTALTTLDLSHNSLTALPSNIFTLPNLTVMNLSHNALSELSFGAPFSKSSSRKARNDTFSSGGFFGPVITRASSPLPRLSVLNASHNKLTASTIDHANLPLLITKADFAANPLALGGSSSTHAFIRALSHLEYLKELRCETADIGDDAFPSDLSTSESRCFPRLRILDMGETRVTMEGLQPALSELKQDITYDLTTEQPPEGTLRVSIGKKVVREAWEVEAERRVKSRVSKSVTSTESTGGPSKTDVGQNNVDVVKEAWEIEAEQGLLTEGGRRRARAAATMSATDIAAPLKPSSLIGHGHPSAPASISQPSSTASLANPQYYHATTQTLTLPPLSAPTKCHARSFSLATPFSSSPSSQGKTDFALPTLTLPLAAISAQSFAQTLKILVLRNRKFDLCVSLPTTGEVLLPSLEELVLDGCGLRDQVSVTRQADTGTTPPRSSDTLLPLLTRFFPSLRTLDLSYNTLTSTSLQQDVLSSLILADNPNSRKGLRHLRLRGNRIDELDAFQGIADLFKGNRSVPDWKLEELDLRDNEISKLPAELGLLPLDVFLVDGNL
jgi:Leucine-rich repeat (LRR) protein